MLSERLDLDDDVFDGSKDPSLELEYKLCKGDIGSCVERGDSAAEEREVTDETVVEGGNGTSSGLGGAKGSSRLKLRSVEGMLGTSEGVGAPTWLSTSLSTTLSIASDSGRGNRAVTKVVETGVGGASSSAVV
jgi:hypothetical protein